MNMNDLKEGDLVVATEPIYADLGEEKRKLHAERGDVGVVEHVDEARCTPTVRFRRTGLATIVYAYEVGPYVADEANAFEDSNFIQCLKDAKQYCPSEFCVEPDCLSKRQEGFERCPDHNMMHEMSGFNVDAVKRAMLGTPDPNNPISRGIQFAIEVAGVTAVALEPQPACHRTGIHMVPVGHTRCSLCGKEVPND